MMRFLMLGKWRINRKGINRRSWVKLNRKVKLRY